MSKTTKPSKATGPKSTASESPAVRVGTPTAPFANLADLDRRRWVAKVLAGLPVIFRDCIDRPGSVIRTLDTPWTDGHHVYASDGKIMVRMSVGDVTAETLAIVPRQDDGRFPDGGAMAEWTADYEGVSCYFPDVPKPDFRCGSCRGTGHYSAEPCSHCDRVGCKACEFNGFFEPEECMECGGSGIGRSVGFCTADNPPDRFGVKLPNGVWANRFYLGLLKRERANLFLRRCTAEGHPQRDTQRAIRFTIDGETRRRMIEGLLMPMTVHGREDEENGETTKPLNAAHLGGKVKQGRGKGERQEHRGTAKS